MSKSPAIQFLHVLPANIGRTYRFLKFMHKNFDCDKHRFLVLALQAGVIKNYTRLLEFSDTIYLKGEHGTKKREKNFRSILDSADNIIWHSIDNEAVDIVKILSKNKKYLNKSSWVENGSDALFDSDDARLLRKHEYIRKSFRSVASISVINKARLKEQYDINAFSVDYPVNEFFYRLAKEPSIPSVKNHSHLNIQLGTDTRVFNRPKQTLKLLQKYKLKSVSGGFVFLPSNITLLADRSPVKCKPEYISLASKISKKAFKFTNYYTSEQYIKYMNAMDVLVCDPTAVTNPEYLLAPLFCGVELYYLGTGYLGNILNGVDSGLGNVRKFSYKQYVSHRDNENVKALFSCFDAQGVYSGWKNFFDSIS